MNSPRAIDGIELDFALSDMMGLASLLLDASSHQDPASASIQTAARLLEQIHSRILIALGMQEDGR